MTKSETPRAFSGMSLFVKCMLLTVFCSLSLALILTLSSEYAQKTTVEHGVKSLGRTMTVEVASTSGGMIRFANIDPLIERFDGVLARTEQRATYGVALNNDGDVLVEVGQASPADQAYLRNAAIKAFESGELQLSEDGRFATAPSMVGVDGSNIVGSVGFIWTPDVDLALLKRQRLMALVLATVAFIGLAGLTALALHRIMGIPLKSIDTSITEIADGDYSHSDAYTARGDDIGRISRHLEQLKSQLKKGREAEAARIATQDEQKAVVVKLADHLHGLAEGNLNKTIKTPFPDSYEQLRLNFNEMVTQMRTIISTAADNSASIQEGAKNISQSSDELSQRTESQAATLEQTAAALDELTASVRSAADGARSVEKIVSEARDEAHNSGEVVQNAVTAMTEIEQSSSHISQIISVIDDIAFQTNLLALNAGVEAARAGEAGRGFAVVASEVRALAQRSSDAAMEIKTLIGSSSQQVERGVDLVGKAGGALNSIVERVGHISSLISEIAEGAAEQSTGLAEINTGMIQLDKVTQQNAAMVEEATAASHMLESDAGKLGQLVRHFNVGTAVPSQFPITRSAKSVPSAPMIAKVVNG